MRIVTSFATAALIAATTTSLASAATFTFAGYTFDDSAEPTSAAGSGNVATFGITPSFNGGSLGTYFGNTSPSAVALGEPSKGGPMGVLNLTYSTPVTLGAGTDFVVFESGNKDGAGFGAGSGFEPFRVTLLTDLGFSSTYTPLFADGFVNNSGVYVTSSSVTSPTTNGLFVYEIDVQALVPGATSVSAIIFQTPPVTGPRIAEVLAPFVVRAAGVLFHRAQVIAFVDQLRHEVRKAQAVLQDAVPLEMHVRRKRQFLGNLDRGPAFDEQGGERHRPEDAIGIDAQRRLERFQVHRYRSKEKARTVAGR